MAENRGRRPQTFNPKGKKSGKDPFYNPIVVTDTKKKASIGGPKKEHAAVRMVVAAPVVVNWNDEHAELTRRIADLTLKVSAKAASFEVTDLNVYKKWKKEMEESLDEQTVNIGNLTVAETPEHIKKGTLTFAKLDIDEYSQKIEEFWRDVSRAYNIRNRLRTGANLYRADPAASIAELYAGSLAEASEVSAGESTFAQLINDNTWFTDSNGSMFVPHEHSRSAGLGYSPAGTHIPLHIGHKNDKTRR